jgi:hypothetical protein
MRFFRYLNIGMHLRRPQDMETPQTPNANQEVKSWFQKNKLNLIFVGVLLATNLITYLVKSYQIGQLKDKANVENVQKGEFALQLATHSNERVAQALTKPLVWAVKNEMIRGNKEMLDNFLTTVVQDSDLELIVIVDMQGTVYLSTDKKYEGKFVLDVLPTVPQRPLKAETFGATALEAAAVSPILGDTEQLGFIYFTTSAPAKTTELVKSIRANSFADPDAEATK